jgi:hypothetical protein
MKKNVAISELKDLIYEGNNSVLPTKWNASDYGVIGGQTQVNYDVYSSWRTKILAFLKIILPVDSDYIKQIEMFHEHYYSNASACIKSLENIIKYIDKGYISIEMNCMVNTDEALHRIFNRFHRIARQLRNRHNARSTLDVCDEYDVQDLLQAILRLYFDDVRPEEWTPSYAGKSARMDFLLKAEKIVIEVKMTRKGLTAKELGDQLIVDVERYKAHQDCKNLICFVYDPEGKIGNPEGLSSDLNIQHKGFAEVIIEPSS